MCELLFILQHISVTNIILSNNVYDISIVCLLLRSLEGQVQGWGWFLTRFPLKSAENNDVGEIVI